MEYLSQGQHALCSTVSWKKKNELGQSFHLPEELYKETTEVGKLLISKSKMDRLLEES